MNITIAVQGKYDHTIYHNIYVDTHTGVKMVIVKNKATRHMHLSIYDHQGRIYEYLLELRDAM